MNIIASCYIFITWAIARNFWTKKNQYISDFFPSNLSKLDYLGIQISNHHMGYFLHLILTTSFKLEVKTIQCDK